MRFRIYAGAAVLAILTLTGFAVASWLRVREPSYGGLTLSQWLIRSPDARVALESMDGQAVRFLWNETLATDSPFKLRLIKLARKQSIVRIDHAPANLRRMRAHAFFPTVAEWGAGEIPLLLGALEDRDADVRLRAKNCLEWVLYKADPNAASSELIRCLKRRKAAIRKHAALAFRRVSAPTGTNGLPLLESMLLEDRSAVVRASAAMALGGIRPTNKSVVEALVAALRDQESMVRRAAILALAEIGAEAQPAHAELLRMLNTPDAEFAPELREALQKIGPRTAHGDLRAH
jgi:hypothetical protein